MKKFIPIILGSALLISGCSNMDTTQQRTLSGGAIGATAGAVGAASGYVYDMYEKDKQAQYNKGYQAGKASSTNPSSSSSGSK
jgi:osmotically inducible lipoprotein OsmB